MLCKRIINIEGIPTIIWGQDSKKVYLYVHGKMGCKESAKHFAEIAISRGYQVISFDLPEHGERKNQDYPIMVWNAVKDLKCISDYVTSNWKNISLYACSLGVYFSLLAYKDINFEKCLFQCPLLNMEKLIRNMMNWFNVTEEQLERDMNVVTPMNETLNYDYWIYSKENPVDIWNTKTYILYPSKDILTERDTVEEFVDTNFVELTVLDGAEHYFTEDKYLEQVEVWLKDNIS